MPSGEPYISQASVSAALDTLIYPSKSAEPNPLERLLLVDLFISDPDLPLGEHIREFALQHILVHLISDELQAKRARLNFAALSEDENYGQAQQSIRIAAQTRNAELLLWTLLYYRYVRTDLALSQETLSDLINVDSRSLRRYFQYAVRQLTKRLISEEWTARIEQHRQKLYASLPRGVQLNLIGRDTLLEKVSKELSTCSLCHLYITGAAGIGKTSFAESVIRRLIDADRLDRVVWLNAPPSCEYVTRSVADALLEPQTILSLRSYVQRYTTALILDNADDLLQRPEDLTELMRELSAAVVVLTSSVYVPLTEIHLHVPLSELDQPSTFALVGELMRSHLHEHLDEDVAPWIWQNIGGNPLAVKIATSMLAYGEISEIRSMAGEQTVGRVFARLSHAAQVVWCALSLLPDGRVTRSELKSIWSSGVIPEALNELLRFFIVEIAEDVYSLNTTASNFVRQQFPKNKSIQQMYHQLITGLSASAPRAVDVAEQVLLNEWLAPGEHLQWISAYWREGLQRGHFVQWITILERVPPDNAPEFQIAYGVALRRSGHWNHAEQIFQQVVHESGRRGDFPSQSACLLEWAILARLQGDYTRAVGLLEQAQRCNVFGDAELFRAIQTERCQIALDQADGASALHYLRDASPGSFAHSVLSSEAFFYLGSYVDCRVTALQALKQRTLDKRTEASLYTLIGRSYDAGEQYDSAWLYFTLALTVLEATEDIGAIARAQANLAAVLLKLGKIHQAQELLERAKPALSVLGDKVGQYTTLHNQRLTNIYFAR